MYRRSALRVIILHVIHPVTHRIATHPRRIVGLEQIHDHLNAAHAGIKPKIEVLFRQDNDGWRAIWTSTLCPPTATKKKNRIALDTDGCTRGSRPHELVHRWAMDGGCRPTKSGVNWRNTTVASARIRETGGKAAYKALLSGGSAGFDAVLGGGPSEDGQYARLE